MLDSPSDRSDEIVNEVQLDRRLKSLLEAIEDEKVPERLLTLAHELQRELALRKQRSNPN